jgi:hypothetical protein
MTEYQLGGQEKMMTAVRRLPALCSVAIAVLVIGTATSALAFAPVNSPVKAAGPISLSQQRPFSLLTRCSNELDGRVTLDRGTGNGGEVRIDKAVIANCGSDIAVTPRALPWTLTVDASRNITVRDVDIELTTPQGTCQYAGNLSSGFFDNTMGLYNINGLLQRRTAGCGLGATLGVDTGFQELILANGTGMTL